MVTFFENNVCRISHQYQRPPSQIPLTNRIWVPYFQAVDNVNVHFAWGRKQAINDIWSGGELLSGGLLTWRLTSWGLKAACTGCKCPSRWRDRQATRQFQSQTPWLSTGAHVLDIYSHGSQEDLPRFDLWLLTCTLRNRATKIAVSDTS